MRSRTELRLMESMEASVAIDWIQGADWRVRVRRCLGGKLTAIWSYRRFDGDLSHMSVGWQLVTSMRAPHVGEISDCIGCHSSS